MSFRKLAGVTFWTIVWSSDQEFCSLKDGDCSRSLFALSASVQLSISAVPALLALDP
jgi:hypothetical protein